MSTTFMALFLSARLLRLPCRSPRAANHFDRAGRMESDMFRDAPERPAVESSPAVRTENDYSCVAAYRFLHDFPPVTVARDRRLRRRFEARTAKDGRTGLGVTLRIVECRSIQLLNFCHFKAGKLTEWHERLRNGNHLEFAACRPGAAGHRLQRTGGIFRSVSGYQNFHSRVLEQAFRVGAGANNFDRARCVAQDRSR